MRHASLYVSDDGQNSLLSRGLQFFGDQPDFAEIPIYFLALIIAGFKLYLKCKFIAMLLPVIPIAYGLTFLYMIFLNIASSIKRCVHSAKLYTIFITGSSIQF